MALQSQDSIKMEQHQWETINEILDTALELQKEKRAAYIEKECEGDQKLKQTVTELLNSIEKSDTEGFLEGAEAYPRQLAADFSISDQPSQSVLIGKTIGKYKILELIGHGGMGSVFLTERIDDAYHKKIALKVLRRGMDTPSNIARFQRERNILATMDHPNIARLLDGGVTDHGLPYLVMEYIDGIPLLEYCNRHQLNIKKRIELFKSVCEAVLHAHKNATIHRDLKPSNIFVTHDGRVKVLDFGIAKLLEPSDPDAFFQTRTGARILTIGYAAPEQFENKTVTTATDCYTLGIVLYELLAGIHPFGDEKRDLSKFEKIAYTQSPAKPSEKFQQLSESAQEEIASQKNTTSSALGQILKGDLDAILMKALRTEPEARYGSVEQILEDINRYNRSLPLIAQSDTYQYRIGKFLSRNRKAVVGGLLILITIIGFGSFHFNRITEERDIAEIEAQKAQTVKNFLIEIFRSSNPRSTSFETKDISAKELLLTGENKITNELNNQPDVYTEIMLAIGDAQKNIDAYEKAEKNYKKALSKSSETTKPLENKLRTYVKLGWLITDWRSSQKVAQQHALNAQKILTKIENPSPALEASVFGLLGRVISVRRNHKKGIPYFEKADSIYVNAGLENSYEYIKMLTGYSRSLLYVFDFKKSVEMLQKSNKLHRQKYDNPTLTIAENYKFMAWSHRELGNFEKSNNYFLKSIDLKRELIGDRTVQTAISMYHLSRNYLLGGDFQKSEELAQKVLNIYQENLEPENQFILQAKRYVAIAKYNQNEFNAAEAILQEIIKSFVKKHGKDHISFANTGAHLAVIYRNTEQFEKSVSLLKECIRINKRELGERTRSVAVDMVKLANTYRAMGSYEKAHKYFRQAESIFKTEIPQNHYRRAEFYYKFAKLKQDMGKSQEARQYFKQAYNIYVNNFGIDSYRAKTAKSYLDQIAKA